MCDSWRELSNGIVGEFGHMDHSFDPVKIFGEDMASILIQKLNRAIFSLEQVVCSVKPCIESRWFVTARLKDWNQYGAYIAFASGYQYFHRYHTFHRALPLRQ